MRRHGRIGYLAQEASVFRRLTVKDNLLAVLESMDNGKPIREARDVGKPQPEDMKRVTINGRYYRQVYGGTLPAEHELGG